MDIDLFAEEKWYEMKDFKSFNKDEFINESLDDENNLKYEDDVFEIKNIGEKI